MQANWKKGATAAASLAVLLALGACGDRVENTEMPQPEHANVEINRQGMEGAKEAGAAQGVANDTAATGTAPATASDDPDVRLAEEVKTTLATHPDFGAVPIEVRSEDGKVTLRGQAPDAAAKEKAAEIAGSVRNVKSVQNLLTVG